MSIGLVYIVPTILFIISKDTLHIFAFLGSVTTTLVSETLKYTIFKNISVRPQGASNCNYLCNDGDQSGRPGMPSSHSAEATFFAAFYFYYTKNPYVRFGLVVYALSVMAARYIKRCHTIYQLVAGSLLGLILTASFIVLKKQLIWKDK